MLASFDNYEISIFSDLGCPPGGRLYAFALGGSFAILFAIYETVLMPLLVDSTVV